MSVDKPPEPIRKLIVVRCPPERAFQIWTEQIDQWWPKSHSLSGDPGTRVLLEHMPGGRLYERTTEGIEHTWGLVTAWAPPQHFAYDWYLGGSANSPTRVEVWFRPQAGGQTQVEVIHRSLGQQDARWAATSPRFAAAWDYVLPSYAAACDEPG